MRSEKILVAVRARPSPKADGPSAISWADDRVFVANGDAAAASFRCDRFLDAAMTQEAAFVASGMATLVQSAVDGYAATIFAYGQTGAGKSHTIFGPERYLVPPTHLRGSSQGFLPRSVALLMDCIASKLGETRCAVRVTCVEIYNESVHDLIAPSARPLTVRWSKATGFFLEDATVASCGTYEEVMTVVLAAAANRVHSSHRLNDRSNRSHCLVTLYVDSETNGVRKYGKLTIVDLAGSERAHDTGAVGTQLKESGYINKSLYCLSQERVCQRCLRALILSRRSLGRSTRRRTTRPRSCRTETRSSPCCSSTALAGAAGRSCLHASMQRPSLAASRRGPSSLRWASLEYTTSPRWH
ncbi:hypothetical protein SPRG_07039 [Saprolegnia parasitica CBS 223.65]|uniref:Kinesin-like protein n=1 Tax=Saprolegnia parasitica (strain CBS 223.65) TaxID=695850 RepID=A0A067CLL9_SAPPC|nr:hypothetical protein SPRG_07039 [Saprolegnia parasitica CBS 223.65]KDO27451.1 hypothetical protein SPRG_07039 [Saprolegnia parasitica CBS 223.65]|eukprot:XP_012201890.1 hypothetical protein SPRG_07039 [Saprolegnia parasitica CBS 223.65]